MKSETQPATGVIDKFKAYREENDGNATLTLPETGVVAVYPKFRNHGLWMQAQRLAKNNIQKAQAMYICKVATFDGEQLTLTDFNAYVPLRDAVELMGEIFGDPDENEDDFLGKKKKD